MTIGSFWTSFDKSIQLLKESNLFKEDNRHQNYSYSDDCKNYSRSSDYLTIYHSLVNNRDYDLQLQDESLLQLSYNGGECRMVFIQNPNWYVPFDEFLYVCGFGRFESDVLIEECKGLLNEDYSQFLSEMSLNSGAVYFRYDIDVRGREGNENIHAYSHLHVGLNNNIRIPVGKELTPLAFVIFVLRHVYYDKWVEINRNGVLLPYFETFKSLCKSIPSDKWTDFEKKDLYID